tara:strand:- start:9574 stop:9927 length:354 start_codon:yes stop_codon:yes gene_type:complete
MKNKTNYTATFPCGTVKTRNSKNTYSHAWLVTIKFDEAIEHPFFSCAAGRTRSESGFASSAKNAARAANQVFNRWTLNEDLNSRNPYRQQQVRKYKATLPTLIQKLEAFTKVEIVTV